jgi:hypothetical protein
VLERHHGPVRAVAWSPDGARVASAGGDMTMRMSSLETVTRQGMLVQELSHDPVATTRCQLPNVAFTADLSAMAVGSTDGAAVVLPLDQAMPEPAVRLLGLPNSGSAALLAEHRYRLVGDPGGRFWWSSGLCRFEPGELDGAGVERV